MSELFPISLTLTEREFEKFKFGDSIMGDCISSSFHILEYLVSQNLSPSYVYGCFFDQKKKDMVYHMVPCVIHEIQGSPVLLSFLDFSRNYFLTLVPGISQTNTSEQTFVWFPPFLYQFQNKVNVERKIISAKKELKPQDLCHSILEIKKYQKTKFLNDFVPIFKESLRDFEKWSEITFDINTLNFHEKICVVDFIKELSHFMISSKKNIGIAVGKKLENDTVLKNHIQDVESLKNSYFDDFKKEVEEKFEEYVKATEDILK
jgi:hypothetical protein